MILTAQLASNLREIPVCITNPRPGAKKCNETQSIPIFYEDTVCILSTGELFVTLIVDCS